MRDLPFILCLVIYSFSPLLVWTHGYLFHTLGFNPLLLYLCSCPNFFSFGQRCSCVSLTYFYFVFFVFFLSTYFLALQDAPSSSFTFPIEVLESAMSPSCLHSAWFLLLESAVKNQVIGMLIAFGCHF